MTVRWHDPAEWPGRRNLLTLWRVCQTDDDKLAANLIDQARAEGATDHDVAVARRERAERMGEQVQTIGAGRCKCSHHSSRHGDDGECWSAACGCRVLRVGGAA